jgi:hypothetical protein
MEFERNRVNRRWPDVHPACRSVVRIGGAVFFGAFDPHGDTSHQWLIRHYTL